MNRAERRQQKLERQAVTPGEVKTLPNGSVVIGAPTATAIAVPPRDEESEE